MEQNRGSSTDTGKKGEELAKTYLEKQGYAIVEQNWRTRYGEIDLVAKKGDLLVVVEVRTRVGEQFGMPEETLNFQKRKQIFRNATAYLAKSRGFNRCRIDAVCVVLGENRELKRIAHYENIAPG